MRVVLATLGDVHPFIALALGLQGRGHTPVFAGAESVRGIAERHGIEFHPIRPDGPQLLADTGMDGGRSPARSRPISPSSSAGCWCPMPRRRWPTSSR